jgi:hypothetical protein
VHIECETGSEAGSTFREGGEKRKIEEWIRKDPNEELEWVRASL